MRVNIYVRTWKSNNEKVLGRGVESPMVSLVLAILLIYATFALLKEQKARQRRVETQRDMPREQLLPRYYKSFVEVENGLWAATEESGRTTKWDTTPIKLRPAELQLVRGYVQELQKDFEIGNRVFPVVVSHSPEVKTFRQLEWHRIKIEFPYYNWRTLIRFRLWTGRISPMELKQLTQIVAALAYEVRRLLNTIEEKGHADAVESLLRNY